MNNKVCQFLLSSSSPSLLYPCINTSCTTGDPSTPKIALVPPAFTELPPTSPSNAGFIIDGNIPAIKGGINAHASVPSSAFIACNAPLFDPA